MDKKNEKWIKKMRNELLIYILMKKILKLVYYFDIF